MSQSVFATPAIYSNQPGVKAGEGLEVLRKNQSAILELAGAAPELTFPILDGVITPTQAICVVDTEGQAPADELTTMSTTVIHNGAEVTLRAADASRAVTLVHGSQPGGLQLASGQNTLLDAKTETKFRMKNGLWYEVQSVRADGSSIVDSGGVLSVPLATADAPGISRPDNKTTFVDANGVLSASGIPLFTMIPTPFSTIMPGRLSVCRDNGVLTAAAWPDAAAQLAMLKAAGETNIISLSDYSAKMTSQGGMCDSFALSDDGTEFRIPCMPGAYWRGLSDAGGLTVGMWQPDQMRPIKQTNAGAGVGAAYLTAGIAGLPADGPWTAGGYMSQLGAGGTSNYRNYGPQFDSSLMGIHFSGSDTHPLSGVIDWQIQMYGAVTDAGSVSLAQLIAAMAGKLDTSRYEADAPTRAKAWARVAATGSTISSYNVTSTSQTGGAYTINSPAITNNSVILATSEDAGGYGAMISSRTAGSVVIIITTYRNYPVNVVIF